jgi:hypothetical protein
VAEAGAHSACCLSRQEPALPHLVGDARLAERLLVADRARVRPVEDGDLVERDGVLGVQGTDPVGDEPRFVRPVKRPRERLGAGPAEGPERLLGPAETGSEAVREGEDLGCRAVVRLEANDRRPGIAGRHLLEVARRRPRERVDRLVIVADGAEVVSAAEPELEERLLQEVHVLVLVDRERAKARAEVVTRVVVGLEHPDRALEQILEIDPAERVLAPLVLAKRRRHQVDGERRTVAVECPCVRLGREPAVLRPLDLGREVAGGSKAVRREKRARDVRENDRLRRKHLSRRRGAVRVELT